ncbi:MAG TPA: aldolase/citrate lyase family protein [Quisquiliibacterium sp.]|nr:aldolase/citrate lyase family protein [Quisquiliibacterium sp.]
MRPNRLKKMFADKQTAIGGWCAIPDSYAAEVMAHCGYDTVVVDLQHGPLYLDAAVPMLQAISTTDAVPMARCSGNNFFEINKLLDAGAYGIVCPLIDSAEDARAFVAACRYPPAGTRSFGPARGLLYGGPDYFTHANDTILTWAMIETPRGLENIEEICAVPGLDGVFVGPSDLSLALGVSPSPKWRQPPLSDALAKILSAAHRAGKLAGIFCVTAEFAAEMKKAGFDFVVHANDASILREAAQRGVATIRG